jgi:hypothetical protein
MKEVEYEKNMTAVNQSLQPAADSGPASRGWVGRFGSETSRPLFLTVTEQSKGNPMKSRFARWMAVTTAALLVLGGRASTAHADVPLVLSLNSGATITATETAAHDATSISATNQPVTISTLDNNSASVTAFLGLSAVSTSSASNVSTPFGNAIAQGYAGSFAITNGATNYLSGTFTGVLLAIGPAVFLISGSSEGVLTPNSSVIPLNHLMNPSVVLSFANVSPPVSIVGSSISSFTATGQASVSASAQAVPEPSSMVIAGLGAAGLIGYGLRRRKAAGD